MSSTIKTTKSFKSVIRAKPKHNGGITSGPRKGGHGGWGKVEDGFDGDDTIIASEKDPNFDPADHANYYLAPTASHSATFVSNVIALSAFKKAVKAALQDYVVNASEADYVVFENIIQELNQSIYTQEIPKIVIQFAIDTTPEARATVSTLLNKLYTAQILTQRHFETSFNKLYNSLDEILVDAPNGLAIIKEFSAHAVSNNMLLATVAEAQATEQKKLADTEVVTAKKAQLRTLTKEYLTGGDFKAFEAGVVDADAAHLHYDLVKYLISTALDRTNESRKLASEFLAQTNVVKQTAIARAFTILLGRVEDLYLDVPNILQLLSLFLARAISDEALGPSFINRVDVYEFDQGYQVVKQADKLLNSKNALDLLDRAWEFDQEEVAVDVVAA